MTIESMNARDDLAEDTALMILDVVDWALFGFLIGVYVIVCLDDTYTLRDILVAYVLMCLKAPGDVWLSLNWDKE